MDPHPLTRHEQDRKWDSPEETRLVIDRLSVKLAYTPYLRFLNYSVSSNETARNPFAAILSRARSSSRVCTRIGPRCYYSYRVVSRSTTSLIFIRSNGKARYRWKTVFAGKVV